MALKPKYEQTAFALKTRGTLRHLGNIHVLRKHKGGREGVSQMLMFAYGGGGGLRGHAYVIIVWKKNAE